MTTTSIYAACLASYNAGRLHGVWIDATQDVDHTDADIRVMLSESFEPDAEEWAIHDYENMPPQGEYPDLSADAQTSSASEVHCRAEDGKRRASRKTALAATC